MNRPVSMENQMKMMENLFGWSSYKDGSLSRRFESTAHEKSENSTTHFHEKEKKHDGFQKLGNFKMSPS